MSDTPGNAIVAKGEGIILSPDPSVLTRELIHGEMAALRELVRAESLGEAAELRARLDAMDRAIVVFQDNLTRVPTETQRAVAALESLMDERFITMSEKFSTTNEKFSTTNEKFHGIEQQFQERDVRVREAALSQTTAVNAALQAQKEAAGEQAKTFGLATDKAEKATGEQIAQQRILLEATTRNLSDKIETNTKGLADQIADLKERYARFESLGLGRGAAVVEQRASAGELRAYAALAITVLLATLAVVTFVLTH